jgi:hypothetical protein
MRTRIHVIQRAFSSIQYTAGLLVLAGLGVWIVLFLSPDCGGTKIRTDGVVVEVFDPRVPRPNATTVAEDDVSYPWARSPLNSPVGPCNDPYFKLSQTPQLHHTYTADEVMTVAIQYKAPGCENMIVGFYGRHRAGSPWYVHWCNDVIHKQLNAPTYDCGAWVPSDQGRHAFLTSDSGTVVFQIGPGHNEGLVAGDPAMSIEGFQLCGLTISLDDRVPGGSATSQEVQLGCDAKSKSD